MAASDFLKTAGSQFAADLRNAPRELAARVTDQGRADRCQNIAELRRAARRSLPRTVFDFVDGAAWDEVTAARNRDAFNELELQPRVLRDVSTVSLETSVVGVPIALPLIGAPYGAGLLFHPDGEAGIARALQDAGTISTVSSMASQSIEDLARHAPGAKWIQMYVWRDRGFTRELIARAREAGSYGALMLTVDTARQGRRERDVRNGFTIPPRITLRSVGSALLRPRWSVRFLRLPPVGLANVPRRVDGDGSVNLHHYVLAAFDPAVTWDDVLWLREQWPGPIVLKGILTAADASRGVQYGVDAIAVSNHGGRQLDHVPASISALPRVVDAVAGAADVLVDGGIRRGTDIAKALALGARACLVGRPLIYGLAAGGQAGAARAIRILHDELELTMTLLGCDSVADLDRRFVEHAGN
jgi:L-lactate dehydrogenase (cytochrome)